MNKKADIYNVFLIVDLLLSVFSAVILYEVYNFTFIYPDAPELRTTNVGFYMVLLLLAVLLLVFFVVELILLILNNRFKNDYSKKCRVEVTMKILPWAFLFLSIVAISVSLATVKTLKIIPNDIKAVSIFNEIREDKYEYDVTSYSNCEKNSLAKIGYFKQSTDFEYDYDEYMFKGNNSAETGEAEFYCWYQQSDKEYILSKIQQSNISYALKNEEIGENYTLYYETGNNNYLAYSLVIEKENTYFVATFESKYTTRFNDYSKEQFLSDSMSIFEQYEKL